MKTDARTCLTDDEIIRNILEDNHTEYYDVLYKRYFPRVRDKCYSMVKNRNTAEELADDILCNAYEKLASFKRVSSFSSWLYSITYNHCIEYLRKKKKLHYPGRSGENEIPEIIDESEENIEDISYDRLMVILDHIQPEEKALLLMKYLDNIPIKQISGALSISDNATKMRLKRARARVLHLYKQMYQEDN